MTSIRDQIIAQVVLELNTSRPVGVAEFERVNNRPRDTAQVPANVVYPTNDPAQPVHNRTGPLVSRQLKLRIEMRVAGGDSAADPSLVWVTQTLLKSNLNKLCHDIQEDETQWAFKRRDKPYCLCVLDILINYGTSRVDQTRTA